MELEVGRGFRELMPFKRRRSDGGHVLARKKAKQVLLHRDEAIHRTGTPLLGGANTRGGGGRRMETDITDEGGQDPPDTSDVHGNAVFMGQHVAVGQHLDDGGM